LRYGNKRAKAQFGFTGVQGIGLPTSEFYADASVRDDFMRKLQENGYVYDREIRLLDFKKQPYWALMSASFTEYEGEPAIIVTINDITARKNAENELRASEEKYRLLADMTADVIWVFNMNTQKYAYISPSIIQLRGYTVEEAMAQTFAESMTPESVKIFLADSAHTIQEFINNPENPKRYVNEIQQPCKNGDLIWVETSGRYRYNAQGQIEYISSSRNIDDRKKKEEEILYLNLHDPLTGLANHTFLQKLYRDEEMTDCIRQERSAILMNIDNFRLINDALGHQAGDQVLEEVAENLNACVGESGSIRTHAIRQSLDPADSDHHQQAGSFTSN
jgi:PAS domain S-box-containing protein